MKPRSHRIFIVALLLFSSLAMYNCSSSGPAAAYHSQSATTPQEVDVPYVSLIDRLRKETQLYITGPDSNPTILIRGKRSIEGNNEPLFVIDGTPLGYGYNSVSSVDVNQVKSIRVLPASQAGLYGSRGGNGVVQIFTK